MPLAVYERPQFRELVFAEVNAAVANVWFGSKSAKFFNPAASFDITTPATDIQACKRTCRLSRMSFTERALHARAWLKASIDLPALIILKLE